ncbi:uncharacterized protein PHACADRAFT_246572 [Phanerochaete carnosa HHB-10118-sp]|uniref:Uncharacterized protein n=1 Tax=Phanerochaete carnosa (strain HHB-10118-sp) TaxID=650164 RepID=K5VCA1_PHACS|nr:uncharacterized protein PHACADRAFT_246572 [Phanerochaete carnosa HHB-10118-sp]EKM60556.1 hypothetical protein PHACADRAFT_246572 [Phanerochaete carnosa HHB-10118-sp]
MSPRRRSPATSQHLNNGPKAKQRRQQERRCKIAAERGGREVSLTGRLPRGMSLLFGDMFGSC